MVFVEKGKIVCEKWQNNECVGGRFGGRLQQGMFISIFHSYLCILVNHLYGFLEPRLVICQASTIEELTFCIWLRRYRISFFISVFLALASLPFFLQLSGSFSSGSELSAFAWVLSLTACIKCFPLLLSPNIRPWTRRALN